MGTASYESDTSGKDTILYVFLTLSFLYHSSLYLSAFFHILVSLQVFLLMAIILAGAWSSKGVGFNDLNSGDLRQKTAFEFMIVVGVFAIVWAIVSVVVFCVRQDLPPIVVSHLSLYSYMHVLSTTGHSI